VAALGVSWSAPYFVARAALLREINAHNTPTTKVAVIIHPDKQMIMMSCDDSLSLVLGLKNSGCRLSLGLDSV
jgi:hypothetical protein